MQVTNDSGPAVWRLYKAENILMISVDLVVFSARFAFGADVCASLQLRLLVLELHNNQQPML